MSPNSPPFFSLSSRCTLALPSLSPRTCVPSSAARSQLPSIGFSPFRLLLIALAATPLTGVSGRADSLLRPLTSQRQRQPCVRTFFFRHGGFLRSTRVDFFLIRARDRVRPPCIKVSFRSSGFFYHDNVPGYFRVYLPAVLLSPPFVLSPHLSFRVPAHDISLHGAYSRIISHVISRVFRMIFFLSPPFSSTPLPQRAFRSFCASPRAASAIRSIYGVFTFSRGSSPLRHVCSRVGYYFPVATNFLLHV